MSVDRTCLLLEHGSLGPQSIEVSKIGVKKFRALVRKKGNREDFQIFQLLESPHLGGTKKGKQVRRDHEERVEKLLSKYSQVFQKEAPAGLPPQQAVDHATESNV